MRGKRWLMLKILVLCDVLCFLFFFKWTITISPTYTIQNLQTNSLSQFFHIRHMRCVTWPLSCTPRSSGRPWLAEFPLTGLNTMRKCPISPCAQPLLSSSGHKRGFQLQVYGTRKRSVAVHATSAERHWAAWPPSCQFIWQTIIHAVFLLQFFFSVKCAYFQAQFQRLWIANIWNEGPDSLKMPPECGAVSSPAV